MRAATLDLATLPGALRARAGAQADSTAVVAGDDSLTYQELTERSTRTAALLHRLGVRRDDRVGIFADPSLDLVVGVWGTLAAGGAYLPLSPEYPEERLRYIIEDARARVILCRPQLTGRLRELAPAGTRVVTLDEAAGEEPVLPDEAGPRPDSLAYVIYTSGSTGRPKGVMVEHRSVVSQMRWLASAGHLDDDSVVLQKTPMSFDAAQWEILSPAWGARLVMGAPGVYRDPEGLVDTIVRHGVTTLQGVPTLLQALVDTERLGGCTTLTRVFSGGEALTRSLAGELLAELPGVRLVNLYGPTECTINSSAHTVSPATLHDEPAVIPIGTPVDGTGYHILDEERRPVGPGEIGELYISGVQLARGYLHRPDLTEERFLHLPPAPGAEPVRLYRTGDLAHRDADGTVHFAGRTDSQVKLRGYRVELDEIARTIEDHAWVKRAAVVVKDDPRTGFQNLIAAVELNPKEAALMDQGNHGAHHQSKASRLQVKAQLANPGLREDHELAGRPHVDLPGRTADARMRREVFARKTYRFYEGGPVSRADVVKLLDQAADGPAAVRPRRPGDLTLGELGTILRWFGQFHSEERLLPKYAYASPGALYATQLYLEAEGVAGLRAGLYYHNPLTHRLTLVRELDEGGPERLKAHFIGKRRAIEPVYRNNLLEVLEFETGHMVGLFERVLPAYGLAIHPDGRRPELKPLFDVADEDHYLGCFDIRRGDGPRPEDPVDLYVQAHPGKVADLPAGQYRYVCGGLERVSAELVQKKHVIAINQAVYERASIGISAVSRAAEPWLEYIVLGRKLHHLQANGLGFGFMSSGYSSKSGNPLPAARRLDAILTERSLPTGASYFFVGGRVDDGQRASEGMGEDIVHMKGPTEMIRDDLIAYLPDYMLPNKVVVLDALPQTANGKIDVKALAAMEQLTQGLEQREFVPPRTATEQALAGLWGAALKYEPVSKTDNFFESGGNSLLAVTLVNRVNRHFGTALPVQVLFETPTVEQLARRIDGGGAEESSRLVRLHAKGGEAPVFCWPGLGGYPMNLQLLGSRVDLGRPFYGIQAHGLNAGEEPYPTIREMAAADLEEIRRIQPEGPYTLWGYSFGARVAFEAAWQLEQAGERVENLFLICPGNPTVRTRDGEQHDRTATYCNPAYLTVLFSVFAGTISGPDVDRCLECVKDEDDFTEFVHDLIPALDTELIRRIVRMVAETYEFDYSFRELAERSLRTPVTLFKAVGDDYSFIEGSSGYSALPPAVIDLAGDHYGVLKEHGVGELVSAIRTRLGH
ncbi:amino acid adenylation domain-containing protein [Streptomyces caatingaensis]|uniref:Amino acid adenylation protein n=1 Tax=Streptomyces caatingaensis TaxID=1678637 RepID=A0A0K9XK43_9ACTN|nr:amino acid adenylation domain-containing protein [Streptomyces caatingaensis]KNB53739.1 amino acid adenylation protein [Streptomyces caatingaensis]